MFAPVAKLFEATSTPWHTERNVRLMTTEPRHVVPKRQSEYAIYEEVDIYDEGVTSIPRTSERNVRLMALEPRYLVPKRQSDYTVYEELVVDDEGVRDERVVPSRPKILDKNVRLKVVEPKEPVARMQPKNAVLEVDVDGEEPRDERARFLTPKKEERTGVELVRKTRTPQSIPRPDRRHILETSNRKTQRFNYFFVELYNLIV